MKTVKIKNKVYLAFALLILIFIAASIGASNSNQRLIKAIEKVKEDRISSILTMVQMERNLLILRQGYRNIESIQNRSVSESSDTHYRIVMKDLETATAFYQRIGDNQFSKHTAELKTLIDQLHTAGLKMARAYSDGNLVEADLSRQTLEQVERALSVKLQEVFKEQKDSMETGFVDVTSNGDRVSSWLFYGILITVIISILVSSVLIRMITDPLIIMTEKFQEIQSTGDFTKRVEVLANDRLGDVSTTLNSILGILHEGFEEIREIMEAVAKGDMTHRLKSEQAIILIGDHINQALEILGDTLKQITSLSSYVGAGAEQLSTASQNLASGTATQAASIEEISSSMEEIQEQARRNNANAYQTQTIAEKTLEEVKMGNHQMEALQGSMNSISETSSSVSSVIKVIDEIAFQTNLLALNAAVEAARAGKYGKGFAVVAEEVRNLASRSAQAAKDTTDLINNSLKEVENGVKNADETAKILAGITSSVNKVFDLTGEIFHATREEASSVDEINRSLTQVNDIVQENSSISEQTAATSQELVNQATQMQQMMLRFKISSVNEVDSTIVSDSPSADDAAVLDQRILPVPN